MSNQKKRKAKEMPELVKFTEDRIRGAKIMHRVWELFRDGLNAQQIEERSRNDNSIRSKEGLHVTDAIARNYRDLFVIECAMFPEVLSLTGLSSADEVHGYKERLELLIQRGLNGKWKSIPSDQRDFIKNKIQERINVNSSPTTKSNQTQLPLVPSAEDSEILKMVKLIYHQNLHLANRPECSSMMKQLAIVLR